MHSNYENGRQQGISNQDERRGEFMRGGGRSEWSERDGRSPRRQDRGDSYDDRWDVQRREYDMRDEDADRRRGYDGRGPTAFGERSRGRDSFRGDEQRGIGAGRGEYGNDRRFEDRSYSQDHRGQDHRGGQPVDPWSRRDFGTLSHEDGYAPRTSWQGSPSYGDSWQSPRSREVMGSASNGRGEGSAYGGSMGTALETHRGRGPKGYKRSDARILEDLHEKLTDDARIDASEIECQVKDGEVTLSGKVNDRESKRCAEDLAESISGVTEVQNQLRIQREKGEKSDSSNKRGASGSQESSTPNGSNTGNKERGGSTGIKIH